MWPQFRSMLSGWEWAPLALVPPAIVLLYFLKLKRLPREVPSTYLWLKSIEDMHVNSIWQRLRQNLLLFLQLLLVGLLIFALFRPAWRGSKLSGGRYLFLVDNSASMAATDVAPTRLHEARRRVLELIDEMGSGDVAMLISFADSAQVVQSFTDNRQALRRALDDIRQTDKPTSLAEALRVSSGLANPGRSSEVENPNDIQVADAEPAQIFIVSDGKFADVQGFSLGNLEPTYVSVGKSDAENVGIIAFSSGRNEEQPDQSQAFGRLQNFGTQPATVQATLLIDGQLADADEVTLEPGAAGGIAFPLPDLTQSVVELRLDNATGDSLAVDNRAWAAVNPPRRSKVLLVTRGNEPLEFALRTGKASDLVELSTQPEAHLTSDAFRKAAAAGTHDLVIFDRCAPPADAVPRANCLYVASLPPGGGWQASAAVSVPQIIDSERSHPLMQLIELGNVVIATGTPLAPPPGHTVLIDTDQGSLFAVAPREGFEDAVLGFEVDEQAPIGTNWPVRLSFPVFVLNTLEYLAGARSGQDAGLVRPGQTLDWKSETTPERLRVTTPGGETFDVPRNSANEYPIAATEQVGVYRVQNPAGVELGAFAVNLCDAQESDVRPRQILGIGDVKVAGKTAWEPARKDAWKLIVLAALAVLLGEWYIYNRRVYL